MSMQKMLLRCKGRLDNVDLVKKNKTPDVVTTHRNIYTHDGRKNTQGIFPCQSISNPRRNSDEVLDTKRQIYSEICTSQCAVSTHHKGGPYIMLPMTALPAPESTNLQPSPIQMLITLVHYKSKR